MGKEIERKFLVTDDGWRAHVTRSVGMRQGYLNSHGARTVRVRVAGERAYLTVKGPAVGIVRPEFEYAIPVGEADAMLALCEQPIIEKVRHYVPAGLRTWEIDVFGGANDGLIVAEIELGRPDEAFARPTWLGEEVSGDVRYYNSSLISRPFEVW